MIPILSFLMGPIKKLYAGTPSESDDILLYLSLAFLLLAILGFLYFIKFIKNKIYEYRNRKLFSAEELEMADNEDYISDFE